ncbi:MAG: pyrimidine 5'-nucleotidase [Anaerolineae bacterium]
MKTRETAGRAGLPAGEHKPPLDYVVFDLDETIYPRDAGVMQAIGERITEYLQRYLGLSYEDAVAMRRRYVWEYGTTLRGLRRHHQIDPDHYMDFVHDIPIEQLLHYDARLDQALSRIDTQKAIFTNASRQHAERVLEALGIRRHFSRIIEVRDVGWEGKPDPAAYTRLVELLGTRPERIMLVEDSLRNLRPAAQLGMVTVLVDGEGHGEVDFVIDEVWQIGDVYAAFCQHCRQESK